MSASKYEVKSEEPANKVISPIAISQRPESKSMSGGPTPDHPTGQAYRDAIPRDDEMIPTILLRPRLRVIYSFSSLCP
jgi:hypothetical protein